jgi:hypothetical protein
MRPSYLKSLLVAAINNDQIIRHGPLTIIQRWPQGDCQPEYQENWYCVGSKWFLTEVWAPWGIPDEYSQSDRRQPHPEVPVTIWEEIFPE